MIRIAVAGLRATVQDRGRPGHAREGIPPGGPADPAALAAALTLAGCDPLDAAIEITGLPFAFSCDDRRIVAATGRDVWLRTRGRIPGWTSVLARPGEEVVVEGGPASRYAYLAVSGGLALRPVLGSRSTYLPASLGPWPRPLTAGDALPLGESRAGAESAGRRLEPPPYDRAVRAIAGPHDDRFPRATVAAFFATAFPVLPDSDRMAVRLGAQLDAASAELLSCGIVAGAVQVPPGGAPIVLLADHQTTGGYPILAGVMRSDLGLVAQAVPGQYLRFARVTPDALPRSS